MISDLLWLLHQGMTVHKNICIHTRYRPILSAGIRNCLQTRFKWRYDRVYSYTTNANCLEATASVIESSRLAVYSALVSYVFSAVWFIDLRKRNRTGSNGIINSYHLLASPFRSKIILTDPLAVVGYVFMFCDIFGNIYLYRRFLAVTLFLVENRFVKFLNYKAFHVIVIIYIC